MVTKCKLVQIKHILEFMSSNTHLFTELLPNKIKHIFRVHIKHYWHFEGVTRKQCWTLFQVSSNTDIFRELLSNNILHTFAELTSINTDIFRELLQTMLHTFPEFIPSNSDVFREFLPD